MDEVIQAVKLLLYAALAHAPEEEDCTDAENEMYADMQNLRESIERWEESKIEDDRYCASIKDISSDKFVVMFSENYLELGKMENRMIFFDENDAENTLEMLNDLHEGNFVLMKEKL